MKLLTSFALERKIDVVRDAVHRIKMMIQTIKHDNKILFAKESRTSKLKVWEANQLGKLNADLYMLYQRLKEKEIKLNKMMKIVPDKFSIGHIDGFRHLK